MAGAWRENMPLEIIPEKISKERRSLARCGYARATPAEQTFGSKKESIETGAWKPMTCAARFRMSTVRFTTHAELTYPDKQARFVEKLVQLVNERAIDRQHKYPPIYNFGQKLIYGTGWCLPDATERQCVLQAIQQLFLYKKLRPYYQDYFFDNALRYLNAQVRIDDPRHQFSPAVRERR